MSLDIHTTAKVSPLADIEASVRGSRFVLGPHSVVDSFVKVKPVGGAGDVLIGSRTVINSGCVLYSGNGIHIGDHVSIAANCVFAPVNHEISDSNRLIQEQGFKPSRGGIIVEDDVWIGAGCVLLDGVILRRGCVIGAMSLVRGEVPAYSVMGGNPLLALGTRR